MLQQPPPEFSFDLEPDSDQVWNVAIPAGGVAAVAILFIGVALATEAVKENLVIPVVGVGMAVLVSMVWLVHRVVSFSRAPRAFVVRADKVSVPAMGMFDRAVEISCRDITRVERVLHDNEQIVWTSGRKKFGGRRLGKHPAAVRAALRLHVAYSLEQRGEFETALQYYEEASDQFEPPLNARLASAYDAADNPDEAEDYYCSAAIDFDLEFGPDDLTARKLRTQLERLLGEDPDQRLTEDRPLREKLRSGRRRTREQAGAGEPLRDEPFQAPPERGAYRQ